MSNYDVKGIDAFTFITSGDRHLILEVLGKAGCPKCGGSGERNDASPGDIGFTTWACKKCDGTGWNKQAVREIIEAVKEPT